jgi:hypothetical protein
LQQPYHLVFHQFPILEEKSAIDAYETANAIPENARSFNAPSELNRKVQLVTDAFLMEIANPTNARN